MSRAVSAGLAWGGSMPRGGACLLGVQNPGRTEAV